MGGFGTALAGALEGVSGAMVREHKETLDADIRNRQAAQAMWQHILTDPDAPPEQKQHAFASFMGIATTPPGKNWNKFTKPYERAQQQPGQQLPPMQMGGGPQGAPVAPPPPPSPMLAPGPAASPGPQAPIAAGGGASPGVLQGGANQLPPMQPMAPPPPPDAPAPDPSSVGAMPPATIPGATIPPVTGPAVAPPMSIPGHGAAMALQSQLKARYDAAVAMGASPEQARMSALGLTGLMRPTPVNVLTTGGQTVVASKHIDPATGTIHFYGSEGNDITPSVVREIGLAVIPKAEVLFGANRVPFAIKHPDGTVVPANDPSLTDDDKHLLASAQPRPVTTSRSGGTTTDALGNTHTSSTSTRSIAGSEPPPPPNSVAAPKAAAGATGKGAASPAAGGSKLDYQINQGVAKDALKASADARKQVNLLDSATDYVTAVNSGKVRPDSAKDLALIVQAVRAMNPGTVRLPVQEIELELKRGTYGQQFSRWYEQKLATGTLPKQYRDELFSVINDETTKVATDAAQNWQQNMRGKPLPPHLKRFGAATSPSPSDGGPPPPVVGSVVNGYRFKGGDPKQSASWEQVK